jgi:protein-disulfide isomerase
LKFKILNLKFITTMPEEQKNVQNSTETETTPIIPQKPTFLDNPVTLSILLGALIIGGSVLVGAFMISHPAGQGTVAGAAQNGAQTGTVGVKVTDRPDQPSMGSASAPVTMYEFGDFQCPFCQSFTKNTLPELKTKYIDTGKVRLVFRHFPLSFHVNAQISAEAAECANRQGKFEAYHDILYTDGSGDGTGLDVVSLKKYAGKIGLNVTMFNQCLDNHETKVVVAADQTEGSKVGVNGTPTFYINGAQVVGAQPVATFEQAIDAALTK